jgi:hypothetical protein
MPQQFLGNKNSKQVHDLHNTKPGCQIDEIIDREYFWTLEEAKRHGYDPCGHCLTGSRR